ncbi:unnamed protein product [Orchesella dallaii]|uniref:WD repeat-containing protein 54 beta-propeller domain-containing protein n=1 Tax=Orchesella dallaii TaxID=48710 RepID=A0ABP1QJ84_9HEXA
MSLGKPEKEQKGTGIYTSWGYVPLDLCCTAMPENLIVNFAPASLSSSSGSSSSSSSSGAGGASTSKKRNDHGDGGGGGAGNGRALVGAAHLDTFLIHEVNTDPTKEFASKHVHSIHLPSALQNRCIIFRAKWVSLPKPYSVKLLVLCTNLATYFYNEMGSKQIFKFEYEGDDADLSRCCRTIGATKANILLGSERGELHVFSYEPRKGNIVPSRTLKLSTEPIAELCARRNGLLVVGSPSGALSVWTISQGDPLKLTEYVLCKPETITSIVLWSPYAIVAYGSGIIRMFNLFEKAIVAQIFAHSRWISCMDVCTSANLLLTMGEDDEARIWSLRRRQNGEQRSPIKLQSTIQIEDMNLIGGRFLNTQGTVLGACNLGNKDIAVYVGEDCKR